MGYYSKLSLKELLDEYFDARLDYWKYCQTPHDTEIGSILIQNYQDIEAEFEKRTFERKFAIITHKTSSFLL